MELKMHVVMNKEEFCALQDFFFIMRDYCKNSQCCNDCVFYDLCNVSPSNWDEDDFLSCFKMEEE